MRSRRDASGEGNRLRNDFWDQASHDLRQPVQSLQLLSRVVARQAADETISQAADHMRHVVDNLGQMHAALLRLVRLECQRSDPRAASVSVGPLLEQTVQSLAGVARGRRIDVRSDTIHGCVQADARSLADILRGLVVLALRQCTGPEVAIRGHEIPQGLSIVIEFAGDGYFTDSQGAVFIQTASAEERHMILGPRYFVRLCRLLGYRLAFSADANGPQCIELLIPRSR